ncbi:DHHW family protein [Oribacterium sinus]|uniref:DHHW family protein n=1 Tax=Oribacterium sinus TaxID=237576 RepID=UPI0028EAFEB9|nr:DHHW family protein [Oribacterium sinus]
MDDQGREEQITEEQITKEKIMEEKLTEENITEEKTKEECSSEQHSTEEESIEEGSIEEDSIEVETSKSKHSEETSLEQSKKDFPYAKVFSLAMMGLLCCLFVMGVLLPLRPRYSDAEKRELKKFPAFSLQGLFAGSYFRDITSWYQDSYPGKEEWMLLASKTKAFYGLQGEQIYGAAEQVKEEIPTGEGALAETFALKKDTEDGQNGAAEEKESDGEDRGKAEARDKKEGKDQTEEGKGIEGKQEEAEAKQSAEAKQGSDAKQDTRKEKEENSNFETDAEGNLQIKKADKAENVAGEQIGSLYLNGDSAYELFYFSEKAVRAHASLLNTVQAMFPKVKLSAMIVPNSFGVILDPKVQEKLASSGMDQAIAYSYSLMDKRVNTVNVFDALSAHKKEYIYFRTDHHWTQLGAYYAYQEYCKSMGYSTKPLSDYQKLDFPEFYGTFYFFMNRPESLKGHPDQVTAYQGSMNTMQYTDSKGNLQEGKLINDASQMLPGNKYNCFMLGDHGYVEIHNEGAPRKKRILVLKDSYGNAFVPLLAQDYRDVYVVDYRHYQGNASSLIREKGIEEILFLNNIMGIGESLSQKMLAVFQ